MKLYVARDEDGRLYLHPIKPYLIRKPLSKLAYWNNEDENWMQLRETEFPELTFENSPMEVRLMREDVVEANYNAIADYEDFLGLVSFMRKAQREANDMIAQVECYQEAQDYIKKAEELELAVDKFIEERT